MLASVQNYLSRLQEVLNTPIVADRMRREMYRAIGQQDLRSPAVKG